MILTEFLPPRPHPLWKLSLQTGVTHAVVKCAAELTGQNPPWDMDVLAGIHGDLRKAGLSMIGMEGDPFDMSRIKLGLPGRDEDLESYRRMLRNMGELGISLLCYNFMAGLGWTRSAAQALLRGGARATRFRLADAPTATVHGVVGAEHIWENYRYFIRAVMPAARAAGVNMALHPDDPPLPALAGIARIFGTPEAFEQAIAIEPCPNHGITFCQANFKLMGADLEHWFRHWAGQGKIHFVHIRDVTGNAEDFTETFHDQAEVDMPGMFRMYYEAGFRGPLRSDHVPSMEGEEPEIPGYGTLGRIFATGYFKGILQTLHIPHQ